MIIRFFKRLRFQRQVEREIDWDLPMISMAANHSPMRTSGANDPAFFLAKKYLRSRFPGAMIELAEGVVTVVRGDLVAKVRV
ncbi:MAG: hypothetical protein JJ939_15855 [Alphaproteobacteria bacterium]|nr:hypothetical protein [Alphaproteobacteria bacterium]